MDLLLDTDQQEIADLARDFFAQHAGSARAHEAAAGGRPPSIIGPGSQLGWFGLTVAESDGGLGLSVKELAIVFREAGRTLAPLRLLATTLAAKTAEASGDSALLGSILAGSAPAALAIGASRGDLLIDADAETALVVQVTADSVSTFTRNHREADVADLIDPATPAFRVAQLGEPIARAGAEIAVQATLAIAASQVGIASASLATAVDYAREREAFGKPIGSFQAIKHRLADVAVAIEAADAQLIFAATALAEDRDGADWDVKVARMLSTRASKASTAAAIQTHGAMGITWEHDAHLYLERGLLLDHLGTRGRELATAVLSGEGVIV